MIEPRHRENLEVGAKILDGNIPEEDFCMVLFRGVKDDAVADIVPRSFISQEDCGTVGCAIGTIAAKGCGDIAPVQEDYYLDERSLDFNFYCKRVFGFGLYSSPGRFLFDGKWFALDNSPKGAAARIRYFLKNPSQIIDGKWYARDFQEGWWK